MLALHSLDPKLRDKLSHLEQHEQAEYQGSGRYTAPRTRTSYPRGVTPTGEVFLFLSKLHVGVWTLTLHAVCGGDRLGANRQTGREH